MLKENIKKHNTVSIFSGSRQALLIIYEPLGGRHQEDISNLTGVFLFFCQYKIGQQALP